MGEHKGTDIIKDDSNIKKVGEIQEILYQIEEENFDESILIIRKYDFTRDLFVNYLARSLIRLSCLFKSKIHLFTRLVSELKSKCDIVTHVEQLTSFGILIGAQSFLLSLIDAGLIDNSYDLKLKTYHNNEKGRYPKIIE